jgi:hypothetical protein
MAKRAAHKAAKRFDFEEDRRTAVIVCRRVHEGAAILEVAHDEDGAWQFLCGGDHGEGGKDGPVVECLECVVADDPSLNGLADLCSNWSARRTRRGAKWKQRDLLEEMIEETIEEHGWFVAKIEAGDGANEPPFAYTVGLYETYGHPELICVGLRTELMHAMLNNCGALIKKGHKPPIGAPFEGVIDDYQVQLRQVRARKSYDEHLGYAIWFNGGRKFPVLQLVWPDQKGRFPGQAGTARLSRQQPLLP